MYLYPVRHGQSEGNVVKPFHGQIDYPLPSKGRVQAMSDDWFFGQETCSVIRIEDGRAELVCLNQ